MKLKLMIVLLLFISSPGFAVTHKRTSRFIDIELNKNQLSIDCSGHPINKTSYISFNLLDGDTYYFFYYRRPLNIKMCREQREEYMHIVNEAGTARIVGIMPDEEVIKDSDRKKYPAGFNKAKKMVAATFIRLQGKDKCKSYFEDDCELPKNYWGGVIPE